MHAHTCAPSQNEHTYYTGSMYVLRYTHMPYALHMLCVTFFYCCEGDVFMHGYGSIKNVDSLLKQNQWANKYKTA